VSPAQTSSVPLSPSTSASASRSSVLEGIVGREIGSRKGRKRGKVDPLGSRLFCAAFDDSWTKAHDYAKRVIAASMGGKRMACRRGDLGAVCTRAGGGTAR
jgi:hypothetical protein